MLYILLIVLDVGESTSCSIVLHRVFFFGRTLSEPGSLMKFSYAAELKGLL